MREPFIPAGCAFREVIQTGSKLFLRIIWSKSIAFIDLDPNGLVSLLKK